MQDLQRHFGLGDFSELVPLFPLPGVVLFPCALLPLHVFEPRYRAMVAHATAGNGSIAMVMLRPGWESNYYGNPPIHETACVGKIIQATPLQGGRYNVILCGVKRARIDVVVSDKPYRTARVELLDDSPIDDREEEAELARVSLLEIARDLPPALYRHKDFARAIRKLDAPLGCSVDLMADSLLLPAETKQALLDELDPLARAQALLRAVEDELQESDPLALLVRRGAPKPSLN